MIFGARPLGAAGTKRASRSGIGLLGLQHVPAASNGMDQLTRSAAVDLVPQVVDVDVYDVGEGIEVMIPDVFGNHGPREDPPRMTHEVFQQGIFLQGQVDALPPSRDFSSGGV